MKNKTQSEKLRDQGLIQVSAWLPNDDASKKKHRNYCKKMRRDAGLTLPRDV